MTLSEAIEFIRPAIKEMNEPQNWIDAGCGSGLFTQALATLLPESSSVLGIDETHQTLPDVNGRTISFRKAAMQNDVQNWKEADGILMANSLHYIKHQRSFLSEIYQSPKIQQIIIIEYDTNRSNPWVPFPITFNELKKLLFATGFSSAEKLATRPSIYGRAEMYLCSAFR